MCRDCVWWKQLDARWGECLCPDMQFTFVPYTQKPLNFNGTLVQFNDTQRPIPMPLSRDTYSCKYEEKITRK